MRDLLTPARDPNRPADLPYLEVSCLTWAYEIGSERDFETSLVIELHTFISGGLFERDRLKEAAPRLARELETLLKHLPVPDSAVEMRQRIAATRQREIDEKQRQRRAATEAHQAERERQRREQQEQKQRLAEEQKRWHAEFERQRQKSEQDWNEYVEKTRREVEERVFWRSMRERDRRNAQTLEDRRREEAVRALRTVAVLYDSSYLMADERQKPSLHATLTWLASATVTNIVAHEVQIELGRHLSADDSNLQKSARRARGRVLALAEEAQLAGEHSYQEAKLSTVVADPGPDPDPLGPDSPTDRILIEYGCHLLREKLFRVVVIATNDGGIRRGVMNCRTATGLAIFALADPFDSIQTQPFQEAVLAIDRDA
jgi:hypothetical protein